MAASVYWCMRGDSEHELEMLAGLAADAKIVKAVHALPGGSSFVAFVQRETANYWAQADDDAGLTAWMQERWPEAQKRWATDIAVVTGDAVEPPGRVAPDASAILEAAAAWKRGEASDEHMKVLFDAVTQMHGQFMQRVEREAAIALRAGEDPNQRLARRRDEMRDLFRRDIEALVKEAGDRE
jgi:hypothetical protein